jgi:hypothetical protein
MLAKTQSHRNFFVSQFGKVGRKVARKIALVMSGTPADGAFKQPLADTIFCATTPLADLPHQGGQMNGVAKLSGQQRAARWLNCFHAGTIAWKGLGWRIPFFGTVRRWTRFWTPDALGRITKNSGSTFLNST